MPKKKDQDLDKPVTQRQWNELIDLIRGMGDMLIGAMKDSADGLRKEFKTDLADFRLEEKLNWEQQRQFNKEISQKVDMNTDSIKALDAKVRYQDDMPERLDHVENQQHALTRRVLALEKKT